MPDFTIQILQVMRADTILLAGSFLISMLLIFASKPIPGSSEYTHKTIGDINKRFQRDLMSFSETAIEFNTTVELFISSEVSHTTLQNKYRGLRDSYKKVEFLIEYLDIEATNKMLNGAPLPKLEPKVADLTIITPRGLQVIDELIAENTIEATEELLHFSNKFKNDVQQISDFIRVRRITDRQFFEASRLAIIRTATLGVTGFDTPGTSQGIKDALTILKNLKDYIALYNKELENSNRIDLQKKIEKQFEKGIQQTHSEEFDDFDRVAFIKEVINPIYKSIKDIHLALDYETIDEVSKYPQAVNYNSENIFAKDFLNNFYYVSLSNDTLFNKIELLGKKLFYDSVLSQNNTMSCSSCHVPEKAFTDGLKTSLSNTGIALKRNSMTLNYSVFASGFFHDLRAKRLEDQFEHVVLSKDEFNSDYQKIIEKLQSSRTYKKMFETAFPGQKTSLKPNNVDYALAAYVMTLNPFDNPVDQYFQGKVNNLPENVQRGFNLFAGKAACATCHFIPTYSGIVPPLYIDSEAEVLGVPKEKNKPLVLDDDIGRLGNGMTQEIAPFFKNAFKTPTLRNISKTAPYMHNGVFETLEEVMDFYNLGGGAGQGIFLEHQTLSPNPLDLTENEIEDIIAFMNALTDITISKPPKEIPRDFDDSSLNKRELIGI